MAQFKGVRKLSQKKYDEMKKAGTLDAGIVYVTPTKTLPVLQGTAEPTTALIGEVGQFYLDTANKKLYQCVSVADGSYEWQAVGGGSGKYLHNVYAVADSQMAYINIVSDLEVPYTEETLIAQLYKLYGNGYFACSGRLANGTTKGVIHSPVFRGYIDSSNRLIVQNIGANISEYNTITIDNEELEVAGVFKTTMTSQLFSSMTITDTVVAL